MSDTMPCRCDVAHGTHPPTRPPAAPPPLQTSHSPQVQATALRAGNSPTTATLGGAFLALEEEPVGELSTTSRDETPGHEKKTPRRGSSTSSTSSTGGGGSGGVADRARTPPPGSAPETPPTTLFFMRSHAQPIVLACHRTRWLVLSWASTGPPSAEALQRATDPASVAESARAAEGAVRRLSLAVDHLSYLRTAKPFLAGCVAYWLWEHGGVRAHVGRLARGFAACGDDGGGGGGGEATGGEGSGVGGAAPGAAAAALVEEGRPAREAFLAAAEEFLKVEALFPRRRDGLGRGTRGEAGGRGGGKGKDPGSDVSFASLLTEGAMQRCPWPGAWDRWVEECLRDAQVSGVTVFSSCGYSCVRACSQVLETASARECGRFGHTVVCVCFLWRRCRDVRGGLADGKSGVYRISSPAIFSRRYSIYLLCSTLRKCIS